MVPKKRPSISGSTQVSICSWEPFAISRFVAPAVSIGYAAVPTLEAWSQEKMALVIEYGRLMPPTSSSMLAASRPDSPKTFSASATSGIRTTLPSSPTYGSFASALAL